jgi:hypothetical protein
MGIKKYIILTIYIFYKSIKNDNLICILIIYILFKTHKSIF